MDRHRKGVRRTIEERYGVTLPSFLSGMGSLLDLGGTRFGEVEIPCRRYDDPWARDAAALRSDWEAVGDYLRAAMAKVGR